MGFALAAAALDMGAEVTVITGPVNLDTKPDCRVVQIETAEEMLAAVEQEIGGQDILIMAAAVADFRPVELAKQKIRRSKKPAPINLRPTPDILKTVREEFKGIIVAFALQAGDDLEPARQKMREKGADYLIVNRYDEPGAGFETETNHVWMLSATGDESQIELGTKDEIARRILGYLAGTTHS
jgi:phosphopantothenoylcysteine decarboxylase/phosphopantothenate--cysteine ligase